MVTWPWQRDRKPARTLRVRSRGDFGDVRRVDFEELAPDIDTYLGQAAYLQLGYFETLTRLIRATTDLSEKEILSRAAGAALAKHRGIVDIIAAKGDDPTEVMLPFREQLDGFRRKTIGVRIAETMLAVYLTAGMLDDFYLALSASYGATGNRVAQILTADDDRQALVKIITDAIAADEEWRDLLSLWGRRLVGDTLLIARGALRPQTLDAAEEKRVEPVFTDLLAGHARRMAAIGLDA